MEQKATLDRSVVTVLNGVELDKYIPLFEKHAVSMELFVTLTEEDLISMGIDDQNHRELLIKYIKKFQSNRVQSEELASLRAEEVVEVIKNTSKHLYAIDVATSYVTATLKNNKPVDFLVTKDKSITSAISLFCNRIESETDGFIVDIDRITKTIRTDFRKNNKVNKQLIYGLSASTALVFISVVAFLCYRKYLK